MQGEYHFKTMASPPECPTDPISTSCISRLTIFAVGGGTNPGGCSSAIYRYVPSKKEWILVESAKLPTKRSWCTCIKLSSEQFLVAGGAEHRVELRGSINSRRVDIATVMGS